MHNGELRELLMRGQAEAYGAEEVFHSLDFSERLYLLKKGYVKRHAVNAEKRDIIESIYGPGYLFPLSPIFASLLEMPMNGESITYLYETMTSAEVWSVSIEELADALDTHPSIYKGLLYEAGRRLKANINRLASNALKDDYSKVAHLLVFLVDEFGKVDQQDVRLGASIEVPLRSIDIAQQLNIGANEVDEALDRMESQGLIHRNKNIFSLPDVNLLKDIYLA